MQARMNSTGHIKPVQNALNSGYLTVAEFRRMQEYTINGKLTEEQDRKISEKQELYQKSMARVQNWPNTIQALRKKKSHARFDRFKQDEEERRRIDQEEALYQQDVKKEIIEKSNKQIYDTNDYVKSFQSKLLLSDVLKERELQIEIAKQQQVLQKMREKHFQDVEEAELKIIAEKELEQKKLELDKLSKFKTDLHKQYDEGIQNRIKTNQERKIEGEILKKKLADEMEIVRQQEEKKKQKLADHLLQMQKELEKKNELKIQEKLEEIKNDEKIEAFTKGKERIMELRKLREDVKFNERQNAKQRLIDAHEKSIKQKITQEEELLLKQKIEADIKAEERERLKKEKYDEEARNVILYGKMQLDKKLLDKQKEKEDDKQYQTCWKLKNEEMAEKELEDKKKTRDRQAILKEYQKKQAEGVVRKIEEDTIKELEDAQRVKHALEEDEKTFQIYAKKLLEKCESEGKNIKPLLLELQNYNKRILQIPTK